MTPGRTGTLLCRFAGRLLALALLVAPVALPAVPAGGATQPAQPGTDDLCRLRWVHAAAGLDALGWEVVPAGDPATGASSPNHRRQLAFAEVSDFLEVPAGRYEVRVRAAGGAGGEPLARKVLGCDEHGYYSVVAFGLDPGEGDREPDPMDDLRRLFGGFEVPLDRGEALQLGVLRDHVGEDPESAYVRAFHAAPGVAALDADRVEEGAGDGGTTPLASAVTYAAASELRRVPPGPGRLEVRFHGARLPALVRPLTLRPGRLHTLIVTGTPAQPGRPLQILLLDNPLRVELVPPLWTP